MITEATWNIINRVFEARDRWEAHFDRCRLCGCPGYCKEGERLHTAYATLKNSINR